MGHYASEMGFKKETKTKTIEGIITAVPKTNLYKIGSDQHTHTKIQINKINYNLEGTHSLQKGQKIRLKIIEFLRSKEKEVEGYSILNDKNEEVYQFVYSC